MGDLLNAFAEVHAMLVGAGLVFLFLVVLNPLQTKYVSYNWLRNKQIIVSIVGGFLIALGLFSGLANQSKPPPDSNSVDATKVRDIGPISESASTGFGEWQVLLADVSYLAPSDGFVSIYSRGNSPVNGGDVFTGVDPSELELRGRFGSRYGGIVVPVGKGEYWIAKPWDEGEFGVLWRSSR